MKTIYIDVETSGLDKDRDFIIELAALYEDQVFHEYSKLSFKPHGFDKITELTGISWGFLQAKGIPQEELYKKFIAWLDGIIDKFDKHDKAVFCGYGADFDAGFIWSLLLRNNNNFFGSYFLSSKLNVQSTLARAYELDLIDPRPENNKLSTIAKYFGIEFQAHSAIEDIKATKQIKEILEKMIEGQK